MKRLILFSLSLLILLSVSYPLRADDADIQARIKACGGSDKYPDAEQLILFDSTRVNVAESGLSQVLMHQVALVLKPAGALGFAVQKYDYDPLSAMIEVRKARILRKNGAIEEIPLSSVIDVAAPARAIYWGARQKILPVGALEPGDALETVIWRKGFTYALLQNDATTQDEDERYIPPMRGHFYDIVPFWSSVPLLLKTYTVDLPVGKPLQYEFYNGEARSWIHRLGDRAIYHWEKSDIMPGHDEANMVADANVAPKLLVSTSPDWQAKSRWFYQVNENFGSFESTTEIKAKVDELTRNCRNDEEIASVLTHWVAEEVRYSGLTMGEGEGYTLHKGEMTFRDRSGVCKDKAGMLITMLRAAGLESFAAMTMAGSRIDRIPADQFNHSVTVWKKRDGSYVLLDPTWVPGVRELWSSAEQQQEYLMGIPDGADLLTTPISPPEKHYFRIRGDSQLSEDGTLTGTFSMEAEGQTDSRIRGGIKRYPSPLRRDYFLQMLYNLAPQAEMLDLSFSDPLDLNKPIAAVISYRIPDFAQHIGDQLVFTPIMALHPFGDRGANWHLHMNLALESRSYPFATACSKWVDLQETIQLPKNYKIQFKPSFEKQSGSAADFDASYASSGNRLTFISSLKLKKRIYTAEEWPNFRAAVMQAKKALQESIVLVKK